MFKKGKIYKRTDPTWLPGYRNTYIICLNDGEDVKTKYRDNPSKLENPIWRFSEKEYKAFCLNAKKIFYISSDKFYLFSPVEPNTILE